MSEPAKRPNPVVTLLLLAVAIAAGAHLSAVPLFPVKILASVVLVGAYGYFTVRLIEPRGIASGNARMGLGVVLAAVTIWGTWAVRIPAFSGWETAFTANPTTILDSIVDRASSLRVSKGMGAGGSTDAPSWLMLGTYIFEALAFAGVMTLAALLSSPSTPKGEGEETATEEQEPESQQAA